MVLNCCQKFEIGAKWRRQLPKTLYVVWKKSLNLNSKTIEILRSGPNTV